MEIKLSQRVTFAVNGFANRLRAGERDVVNIFSVLLDNEIGQCHQAESKFILNCQNKQTFGNELDEFLQDWDRANQLIFYYSGHGIERNNRYYLQFGDSDSRSYYPFDNLLNEFDNYQVKKAIIIIDACYSGNLAKGEVDVSVHKDVSDLPKGYMILSSSSAVELSHEMEDGTGSVYTKIFYEALKTGLSGKPTEDGYIYAKDLSEYIKSVFAQGRFDAYTQTPKYKVSNADQSIWIAKNKSGKIQNNTPSIDHPESHFVRNIDELRVLYETTDEREHPCESASIEDLDMNLVNDFFEKEKRERRIESEWEDLDILGKLEVLGLFSPIVRYGQKKIHKSAVIGFHKHPEVLYPYLKSKFVVGPSKDFQKSTEVRGPISHQINKFRDLIIDNLDFSYFDSKGNRIKSEFRDDDLVVIRELISNAFAHRDYGERFPVQVSILTECIEIKNPGCFPKDLNWEYLLNNSTTISKPKNDLLSYYLSSQLTFEGIGRGFDIVRDYVVKYGEDSITFEEIGSSFTVVRIRFKALSSLLQKNSDTSNVAANSENFGLIIGNSTGSNINYAYPGAIKIPKQLTPIPSIRPSDLVGRNLDLQQIHKLLFESKRSVSIVGLGGIGKTTLAAAYLFEYFADYEHIAWITQNEQDIVHDFAQNVDLRESLNLQELEGENISVFHSIIRALRALSAAPKLLVIDNATSAIENYIDILPAQPDWHLIITSREEIFGMETLLLDTLDPKSAVELFKLYCSRITDNEEILKIVETVGYHTLVVEILARTAQRQRLTSSELLTAIEQNVRANVTTAHSNRSKIERIGWYLEATFDFSDLEEDEIWLLKHFVALPAQFCSFELLKTLLLSGKSKRAEGFADLLEEVARKGWLGRDNDSYKMHRIVNEVAKKKLQIEPEDIIDLIQIVDSLLVMDDLHDNPVTKMEYVPYGNAIVRLFPRSENSSITSLYKSLASVNHLLGNYMYAKELLERAIASDEVNFGSEHPITASGYSKLAMTLRDLGDYEGAKELLEKELASHKNNFDPDHPSTVVGYSNLAMVLSDLGDFAGARELLEKAIVSDEANFGPDHPRTATGYSNLAMVLSDLGDFAGARELLEKAIVSDEANFGPDHPRTATRYNNLAMILRDLDDFAGARELLEKAITSDETNFGPDHPRTATGYSNLAKLLSDLGDFTKARELLEKAIASDKAKFGSDHPRIAAGYSNLAMILRNLGDFAKARELLEKAIASDETNFGLDHPRTATGYYNLAVVLNEQNDYKAALKQANKALHILEANFPYSHPSVISARAIVKSLKKSVQ